LVVEPIVCLGPSDGVVLVARREDLLVRVDLLHGRLDALVDLRRPWSIVKEPPARPGEGLPVVSRCVSEVGEVDVLEQVDRPELSLEWIILTACFEQRELENEVNASLVHAHGRLPRCSLVALAMARAYGTASNDFNRGGKALSERGDDAHQLREASHT
jgi:hypothetical protein